MPSDDYRNIQNYVINSVTRETIYTLFDQHVRENGMDMMWPIACCDISPEQGVGNPIFMMFLVRRLRNPI